MKKITALIICAILCVSAVSCGTTEESNEKNNREASDEVLEGGIEPEFETDEQMMRSSIVFDGDVYDYSELRDNLRFQLHAAACEEDNPGAYAAAPVRVAVASLEGELVLPGTYIFVPMIEDGKAVEVHNIYLIGGELTGDSFPMRKSCREPGSAVFNSVFDEGDLVLFTLGESVYAMWEDGIVRSVTFPTEKEYEGNMTFDELDQGYNRVSAEKFGEVFYSPSAEKGIEDTH